jgi:hypothetical protein
VRKAFFNRFSPEKNYYYLYEAISRHTGGTPEAGAT